jgi:PHP family Zn ribbon phosphoesterase
MKLEKDLEAYNKVLKYGKHYDVIENHGVIIAYAHYEHIVCTHCAKEYVLYSAFRKHWIKLAQLSHVSK